MNKIPRKPVPYWILSADEMNRLESLRNPKAVANPYAAAKVESRHMQSMDRFELVPEVEIIKRADSIKLIEVRPKSPLARFEKLEKIGRRISRIF